MIHSIYTMTLRRYAELDDTQNEDLLKRWFNPFPVRWFNTQKFFESFNDTFGQTKRVAEDAYLLRAYNTLLMLDKLYTIVSLLMDVENTNALLTILGGKPKSIKSNLPYYIEKIKQYTRIDVTKEGGLKKLHKEILRKKDKYQELLNENKPKEANDFNFMDLVHGTFSAAGEQYNPSMTIYEFSKLKKRAEKIIKKTNNGSK